MDDVLAISAFALTSALAFAEVGEAGDAGADHALIIAKAPIQLVGGCLVGILWGTFVVR